jgi:hypothetical protein
MCEVEKKSEKKSAGWKKNIINTKHDTNEIKINAKEREREKKAFRAESKLVGLR